MCCHYLNISSKLYAVADIIFHICVMFSSANKFWSGLLHSYYLPRASSYFSHLSKSLRENKHFQVEKWRSEWISYSNEWQAGSEYYSVKAEGNAIAISEALFGKYIS